MARLLFLPLLLLAACAGPEPLPERPQADIAADGQMVRYWFPVIVKPETVRGLAYCCGELRPGEADALRLQWSYDYTLRQPGRLLDNGAEYVPFLWCDIYPSLSYGEPTINYFAELRKLAPGYAGWLLFANEPDLRGSTADGGQCERTPRQVAYMLKAVRQQCPGCKVVGPNVSHIDFWSGWPWLREFYSVLSTDPALAGVRWPEAAAFHDYTPGDPARLVDSLFAMLAEYPGAAGVAWVTEFGSCDPAWVRQAVATYERDGRIARYAYFTGRDWPEKPCMTLADDGGLTAVGRAFAGVANVGAYP